MNPQAAGELVQLWLEAHDDPASVVTQRGPVSRAIRELAPDGHLVGVGQTPTGPAMAVLLDSALLVFQARPMAAMQESSVPVRCRLLSLMPGELELGAEVAAPTATWAPNSTSRSPSASRIAPI